MKKKEMITNHITSKRSVIYAENNLILMMTMEVHSNYTIKSEIIVTTLENIEELLKIFAI